MNDAVRGVVLLASLLLWLPFLRPVVEGTMPVEQGLLGYAAGLALAWAGGAGLTALVRSYRRTQQDDEADQPLRRSSDTVEQTDPPR